MFRSVEPLLKPRSIAIVGASESGAMGWPKRIYENLVYGGFRDFYLVNPARDELWGHKVYPDLAAVPEAVDLALMLAPAPAIPAMLAAGVERGIKCALIYAAFFGEDGDAEGLARAGAVTRLCQARGLRVSGPNCVGALSVRERLLLVGYPSARVRGLPAGPVGVVFQSGGTFMYWLQQVAVRGLGFSYAISSGNELDLDLADYINFLVEDQGTRLIACLVEGVRRPDAFMAACERALAARKPILVLKVGRSEMGKDAARTHTGALAVDDRVFDAVCEKAGIVRCASLDDLIETSVAFSAGRFPSGGRVGMVCFSGGTKGLFLDHANDENLHIAALTEATAERLAPLLGPGVVAANPLDAGAGVAYQQKKFSDICRIVAADPNVDLFAMQGQLPIVPTDPSDSSVFAEVAAATAKPVLALGRMAQNVSEEGRQMQRQAGVPFLQGLPAAARAMRSLARYGKALERGMIPLPAARGSAENLMQPNLDRLLAAQGLVAPRSARAGTAEEAAALAEAIGFPVALKIVSPQASHKTEVGGVTLNLPDAVSVRAAAQAMAGSLAARNPEARIDGYLVQEMVSGLEMILGVRSDPQFGPLLMIGLGGVFVEALNDIEIRLLPVGREGAREMLESLRGKAVLGSFRGRPARDVEAIADAAVGLSRFFLDRRPWLEELEVNPLIALGPGEGVRAVDVRAVLRR